MIKFKPALSIVILTLCFVSSAWGQYFQQYVTYDMNVRLDEHAKTLTVQSKLMYVNQSSHPLKQILMHLIPNAFNKETIAHEVWQESGIAFDIEKDWTGITIDSVLMDTQPLPFEIRDDTILEIDLPTPLEPGDTLAFDLDWHSLIHPHMDRSGWDGEQFDLAQWYPKFVVYDENGWHDDPFGDWGEFYGEFGDFTITFDLPETYVIGATGIVVEGDPGWERVRVDTSQAWEDWTKSYEKERLEYRSSHPDSLRRMVTFLAENVHDYAAVISPDLIYEHGNWNDIDVHVLFSLHDGADWTRDVAQHGVSAIKWLSEKFGPYPWPQITITQGLLSGGMEYPMLIMDSYDSEGLVVHEIGHNWFYGIFGNDELDDAWLDEGFTTFQTFWYMCEHYPENDYDLTRDRITRFEYDHLQRQMYLEADFKPLLRFLMSPMNEPLAQHSYDFSTYRAYSNNVYDKSSYMMQVLKSYLGEDRFLAGMRLYYDRWALKHVTEERFVNAMEDASGEELDWFFDQWLHTSKHVDYALGKVQINSLAEGGYQTLVSVENKGGMFMPVSVTGYSAEGETVTAQLKEFRHRKSGVVELRSNFKPVRFYVDADNIFFDTDRRNNDSQRKRAWRYNYKGWNAYPDDRNLYLWKPQFGYNDNDGLGLGIKIDQVYRNTGDFVKLNLDYNLGSKSLDLGTAFSKQLIGQPFGIRWYGSAAQWRETIYADLAFELNWARVFGMNPIHYLTLRSDFTEAAVGSEGFDLGSSYTRIGFQYELQNTILKGAHGFSFQYMSAPNALNVFSESFNQVTLMNSWIRQFRRIRVNNRTNALLNSSATPALLMSHLASKDLRNTSLDRLGSSLYQIDGISGLGSAYYLAGGGRMRGYADSLDVPVNYIWSNNLEINFPARIIGSHRLAIYGFLDVGQFSYDATDWTWVSDYGLGLEFKPSWKRNGWLSTLLRPVNLKIQIPLGRLVDDEFTSRGLGDLWLFSISN